MVGVGGSKSWSFFVDVINGWPLNKAAGATFNFIKKETLAQVFSCEFCEIFKNTFYYRTPPVAASAMTVFKVVNGKSKYSLLKTRC